MAGVDPVSRVGRICGTDAGVLLVEGLSRQCRVGDRVAVHAANGATTEGEVLRIGRATISVLVSDPHAGVALGDRVVARPPPRFCPDDSWIGRVLNADGQPLDGRLLAMGETAYALRRNPPPATSRRALGGRVNTGLRLFNTLLPLVRGQRIGLFSGSGIGKSTLIGQLAQRLETDVAVIALVGERGRELREFIDVSLGPSGMARAVVIAETSDRSPLEKRRAAWAAAAVAEYFRDRGRQVLLVVDSITRFAEAHREVALAAGENAAMRGFPPSTAQAIMGLCERAGPGSGSAGDITALFSVLVAGSDMEEPVADILRGTLDGHVVLDRKIAERGRFPAVDVLRSVSRSLPRAADTAENALILAARKMLGAWDSAELMVQSGLYERGTDAGIDRAIEVWPRLDALFAEAESGSVKDSFTALEDCLTGALSEVG